MTDQTKKWLKAAPLPALIITAYLLLGASFRYTYAVDGRASDADKAAALAVESKREQIRRLERMEEKIDALTEAIAQLNLATTVRLNKLEAKEKR